jgi:hypothetical protein
MTATNGDQTPKVTVQNVPPDDATQQWLVVLECGSGLLWAPGLHDPSVAAPGGTSIVFPIRRQMGAHLVNTLLERIASAAQAVLAASPGTAARDSAEEQLGQQIDREVGQLTAGSPPAG